MQGLLIDYRDLICSLWNWWKDFLSSSSITSPLGLSCDFILTFVFGSSMRLCSWGCPGAIGSALVRTWWVAWLLKLQEPLCARCGGKPVATGARDMALPGAFSSTIWQAHEGQPWPAFFYCSATGAGIWGKKATNAGGLPPACYSAVASCFPGSLVFLHRYSPVWISSLMSLQVATTKSSLSWLWSLNPTIQLPTTVCSGRHIPQSRAHRATTWSVCIVLTLFPLPQINHFTILQQLQKFLFCPSQLISTLVRGLPLMWESPLSFSMPPYRVQILLHFFSSSLLSFFLPSYTRIIIVPTGDQSLR